MNNFGIYLALAIAVILDATLVLYFGAWFVTKFLSRYFGMERIQ